MHIKILFFISILIFCASAFATPSCQLFATVVEMLNNAESEESKQDIIERLVVKAMGNRAALGVIVRAINFHKLGGTNDAAWMQCGGT